MQLTTDQRLLVSIVVMLFAVLVYLAGAGVIGLLIGVVALVFALMTAIPPARRDS